MMMKRILSLCAAAALILSLLSACGGGQQEEKEVDLSAFAETLMENHEFSIGVERTDPEDEFGAIMLAQYLPGLTDLDLAQMEVYMCAISINSGEFALVRAKSADNADKVKNIFQARIDGMTAEGMNYPATIELWTNSAQVVQNGTYVMLICHQDVGAIVDEFNALFQ